VKSGRRTISALRAAGGIDGTLRATLAINRVTGTGESDDFVQATFYELEARHNEYER